ncbi:hypothetical protein M405DRAFT_876723 [Rhizopogon salebrosus TDB-379]|nr:hypothetical protein M405DRAFT_876723 [Rhizopogon salebrosus TDB-379]
MLESKRLCRRGGDGPVRVMRQKPSEIDEDARPWPVRDYADSNKHWQSKQELLLLADAEVAGGWPGEYWQESKANVGTTLMWDVSGCKDDAGAKCLGWRRLNFSNLCCTLFTEPLFRRAEGVVEGAELGQLGKENRWTYEGGILHIQVAGGLHVSRCSYEAYGGIGRTSNTMESTLCLSIRVVEYLIDVTQFPNAWICDLIPSQDHASPEILDRRS